MKQNTDMSRDFKRKNCSWELYQFQSLANEEDNNKKGFETIINTFSIVCL